MRSHGNKRQKSTTKPRLLPSGAVPDPTQSRCRQPLHLLLPLLLLRRIPSGNRPQSRWSWWLRKKKKRSWSCLRCRLSPPPPQPRCRRSRWCCCRVRRQWSPNRPLLPVAGLRSLAAVAGWRCLVAAVAGSRCLLAAAAAALSHRWIRPRRPRCRPDPWDSVLAAARCGQCAGKRWE